MPSRTGLAALLLACGLVAGAAAQSIGYNFRSGDLWVDTQLGYFSDYGRHDRAFFVDDLVESFGAPRYLVNDLLDKRHWDPGDVYYAAALAYAARRPLADVAREYDAGKGEGWGVVAQRLGIKPGSTEFHALKGQMDKAKGRYDAHDAARGAEPPAADEHKAEEPHKADKGKPASGKEHGH